jgi:hypothetical protein
LTVLREKRPYLSQSTRDSLELHRINLVAESDLIKLVVFAGIDYLTYQLVLRSLAEGSGRSVEFPTQSVFYEHVRVHRDMARGEGRQLPNGKSIILGSTYGKEDV